MRAVLLALFVLTYAAISARRLHLLPIGRPAAALVGAVLCVAAGAFAGEHGLSIDAALRAVEPHTLTLLFGMMIVSAALDVGGFFSLAARHLAERAWGARTLVVVVTVASGLLSAVLVNDAVCLLATPLIVRFALSARLPLRPFLFALCMGANAGSALTLSGNPQNMLVAQLSQLSYRAYFVAAALPALLALAATAVVLVWLFRRDLAAPAVAPPAEIARLDGPLLLVALGAVVALVVANLLGAPLALSAIMAASVCLVAARHKADTLLQRVDWSVLVFFSALFVLVATLQKTGYPAEWLAWLGAPSELVLVAVLLCGSQVVSNVPLILLLEPFIRSAADPGFAWTLTALVSTLAGNLTLLGSVANIIVIERAASVLAAQGRDPHEAQIGFFAYLRVGLLVTLLSLALSLGALWIVA